MTEKELENLTDSIYKVPERISRLDETTTAELIYFILEKDFNRTKRYTFGFRDVLRGREMEVLERLFIYQNHKFEPADKRLSKTVLQHYRYYLAMDSLKFLKMKKTDLQEMFENMLKRGDQPEEEKNIIQSIIDYLRVEPGELFIKPHIIEPLFDDLKQYFDTKDHYNLNQLLKGEYLSGIKIVFKGTTVQLVNLFRRLEAKNFIMASKKHIERWLVEYFEYTKNGKPTPLKSSLVYSYLSKDAYSEIPENSIICNRF